MIRKLWWLLFLVWWPWLFGCRGAAQPTLPPQTVTPPPPQVAVTRAPSPVLTAQAFFDAWKAGRYEAMYALLTLASRDAVSPEDFTAYVRHLWVEAALQDAVFTPLNVFTGTDRAEVRYRLTLQSAVVGELTREPTMELRMEEGMWRIVWDEGLFLPELRGGGRLRMDILMPLRGDIFDRQGVLLATQAQVYALGLIPSQMNEEDVPVVLRLLSRATGRSVRELSDLLNQEFVPWYIPIGEVSAEQAGNVVQRLQGFAGVVIRSYNGRFYPFGSLTFHPVGYVSPLQPDELEARRVQGYSPAARVGRAGLEAWGEDSLRGRSGGTLYVVDAQDPKQVRAVLAQSKPQLPAALTSTLDVTFQDWVCFAIKDFGAAAAVVLERDTGRVLAMCSRPGFNPNAFEPENFNSAYELQSLNDPTLNDPFLNRATRGLYPPGSAFKIVTMAAALESGLFTPDTIYDCGYEFTELPGVTLTDWTLKYDLPPSGPLNLIEGLMRSCNPYFWHIGLALYQKGQYNKILELARAFGLGEPTGIEIGEEEGNIPTGAKEPLDAVNLAIGQGSILVTPLQMARLVAAVGNGGKVLRPQLVERLEAPDGTPIQQFEPQVVRELPVRPETLAAIREGMYLVANDPRGTAYFVFVNFPVPVYGKTGTAENPLGEPHAWFVAFTDAQDPDRPDVALAVLLEHGGSGGDVAAPVARRILETYFFGRPQRVYPWERAIGVVRTPEPTPTPTPTEEP